MRFVPAGTSIAFPSIVSVGTSGTPFRWGGSRGEEQRSPPCRSSAWARAAPPSAGGGPGGRSSAPPPVDRQRGHERRPLAAPPAHVAGAVTDVVVELRA